MYIGIIGNGFVGKATALLHSKNNNLIVYDIIPELCKPIKVQFKAFNFCDIIFLCLPTPMNKNGSCHTDILEEMVYNLKKFINFDEKIVIIRSTVPVGTTDNLNCYFFPEFLTEKNYLQDFVNNQNWIFGLKNNKQDIIFKKKITELINLAYQNNNIKCNNIEFIHNSEAEMVKMFRNSFLATKVAFCNEMYEFCHKKNIDYDIVKDIAVKDKRIGKSHTDVPGSDGKTGFGGICLPKDMNSLLFQMNQVYMNSYIIKASINRNNYKDRKDKDWQQTGRSII